MIILERSTPLQPRDRRPVHAVGLRNRSLTFTRCQASKRFLPLKMVELELGAELHSTSTRACDAPERTPDEPRTPMRGASGSTTSVCPLASYRSAVHPKAARRRVQFTVVIFR
jgi:hypothetical protein